MGTKGYTIIGWIVWRIIKLVVSKKVTPSRAKLGAAGVVALVLIGGVIAARAATGDDDS